MVLLFTGFSCTMQSAKVEPLLQNVDTLIEEHPDSALVLLNEIPEAHRLKKSVYYEYFLLLIQAKDKSYKDITSDTLIFNIQKYYANKNDIEKAALATFYCGRILQEQRNYEKALQTYIGAEKYLKQSKNENLKGLFQSAIGQVYDKQLLHEKAAVHYKLAKSYFHEAGNHKNEISDGNMIGNCLMKQEKTDSAFTYYNEALALAQKYGYGSLRASILMGMGVANKEMENWQQAERYFKMAIDFSLDSLNKAKLAANLARVFELQGKPDSAVYLLQEALNYMPQEQNNSLAANIYKTWSAIEEKAEDFQRALKVYKLYNKHLAEIIEENKNSAILEIEAKYNFQLIENKNKRLLIERQRNILLSLVLLLIFVAFILLMVTRSIRRERILKETEQKVRQLTKLARSFDDKEESFRNILIRHFDIIKKTALLEGFLNEDDKKTGQRLLRKFNEVVYGQKNLDWDVLYQTLNSLSNGFFKQFKNKSTQLDESEFRICCLIYVDFNNTEIALILNYSINTVQAKKSAIRKKLGVETFGNIRDFMKMAIKK